jgi:hypothetical protein
MLKPKPMSSESMRDFMARCTADDMMTGDYPDKDKRTAACQMQWDDGKADGTAERKAFIGIDLKADKPGSFTARIATLNVIDKDGDVTLPGAFPAGKSILISSYMHSSWGGQLPVGKGVIREEGNDVFVDGEFYLDTPDGRAHYDTIKHAPELQEWSYGFLVKETDQESEWAKNPKVWRVLKQMDVFEASPVLRGAGENTATLAIKSDQGLSFAAQAETALAAVTELVTRAKSLADLRRKEGRDLSAASRDKIKAVRKALTETAAEIQSLLDTDPITPLQAEEGRKALLQLLKTTSLLEV